MNRRRVSLAAAAFLLIVAGVLGIRILDPFSSTPPGPELDFSESPEEIVHDALIQLEHRDYTVNRYRSESNVSGNSNFEREELPLQQISREKHENSEQQYIEWTDNDSDPVKFVNPYFAWEHNRGNVGRTDPAAHIRIDQYWNEQILLSCHCVRMEHENDSHLVLAMENESTLIAIDRATYSNWDSVQARFIINKQERALERVRYRMVRSVADNTSQRELVVYKYSYRNWGTTEVQRPSWATYAMGEAIKDIQNVERVAWLGK